MDHTKRVSSATSFGAPLRWPLWKFVLDNGNHLSDWTSLDPAIVSFRQFPQYNMNGQQQQPPQQPQGPHQPNPDFILSQINQQNLQSAQGGHFFID